jgi:CheY-like chemotaxis protein
MEQGQQSDQFDQSTADENPAILVVDDDEDSRRILMYGLGSAGYRVLLAENGAAAVEMCRVVLPSLVIMDLAMPEMDGYTAVQALKADERTREVPVIAWSARVFAGDSADLLTAGFDEVLAKPALPADVLEAVRRHVPAGRAPRAD